MGEYWESSLRKKYDEIAYHKEINGMSIQSTQSMSTYRLTRFSGDWITVNEIRNVIRAAWGTLIYKRDLSSFFLLVSYVQNCVRFLKDNTFIQKIVLMCY